MMKIVERKVSKHQGRSKQGEMIECPCAYETNPSAVRLRPLIRLASPCEGRLYQRRFLRVKGANNYKVIVDGRESPTL